MEKVIFSGLKYDQKFESWAKDVNIRLPHQINVHVSDMNIINESLESFLEKGLGIEYLNHNIIFGNNLEINYPNFTERLNDAYHEIV